MQASSRPWVRICQDTINNGKAGTKPQCLKSATTSLKEGKSVFIDRCNLNKEQRVDFVKLGGPQVEVHAVVLDLPAKLCISRIAKRTGHEGNLQGGKAAAVVNRMLQNKELPKLSEGFSRIMFCQSETDVQTALNTYTALGPSDTLPHGCFGQKDPNAKTQLGIMKFLKRPHETNSQDSTCSQLTDGKGPGSKAQETVSSLSGTASQKIKISEDPAANSISQNDNDVPTLAFPSISTADFRFDLEKASNIIVEKVEQFMDKLGNARLVLVDLTQGSKILSLVRAKAAQKNIDSKRFFTFVGNITQLHSKGGLHCNVIANAANWRLKPGGGGVNAAIFDAGGPALESATKNLAKSLLPGNALVVPLPSTSPLYSREGVTHVIHVLGPNMNPHRPNCLDNDYIKGCKILEDAYSSLFEGFLSIAKTQVKFPNRSSQGTQSEISIPDNETEGILRNHFSHSEQEIENCKNYESDSSKKCNKSENAVVVVGCKEQDLVSPLSGATSDVTKAGENQAAGSISQHDDVPTLAFPSISTAGFQFDLEKASTIIVDNVEEFMDKLGNARLVLVDLSNRSEILSLVRAKAAQKNIDSKRFFTYVGDITRLYSEGGLRCNVIANAANWRLKPGGGGVNSAIFDAGGPDLEAMTKNQASSLLPGEAVVVPLPSTSPLYTREGVTHVIHVLGPNMNPERPNCLDGDYIKGCKILQDAYSSLFEKFLSIANTQVKIPKISGKSIPSEPSVPEEKIKGTLTKSWSPWVQALYKIAMQPEKYKNEILEASDDVVVLNDMYPKAKKHLLVLARFEGLDCLADARKEHIQTLKTLHAVGLKWAEKFLHEDASLVFRLGYHSVPSMRQLHLHVISQDFDSKHLKNKKHWNSFNTDFFRDSLDVIEEVNDMGKAILEDEKLLSMELRCHRCRSVHPNMPRLKSHISNCQAPFPASLNGRLVLVQSNSASDP
ncbi:Histidine triad (HIT) protein [Corchorus olitorius]|uniref:Histidine triad (HIT) protein n=1 Tax=Corchorus olitorius TaxID=93759 RepID=A0A1R3JRY7_9ROSI|nr:Histidine triad (HIT) protein [Corchorus olitorius]